MSAERPGSPRREVDALTVLRGRLVPGLADGPEGASGPAGPGEIPDGLVVLAGSRIRWAGPVDRLDPETADELLGMAGAPAPRDADPAEADLAAGKPGRGEQSARDELLARAESVPLILPGLVDLHCHGGGGFAFGTDADSSRQAARFWARHGTTSVTASLVTAPAAELTRQVEQLRPLVEAGELAGIHLEGPFLTPQMCGAQDPRALIHGSADLLDQWIRAGQDPDASSHGPGALRTITLAPDVPGFAEVLSVCRARGVVPSIGHTAATAEQVRAALDGPDGAGLWTATHLFNRMPPLGHREPGPVPVLMRRAAANPRETVLELIADGVHLDPEIIRWVFATVGAEGIALITDSMAAAGMPDGDYILGSLEVEVRDGQARLTGSTQNPGALAGGTSTALGNLRRCVSWGIPLHQAVRASAGVPARVLGLTDRGSVTAGNRADLLITDPELNLLRVYQAGERLDPAVSPTAGHPAAPDPTASLPTAAAHQPTPPEPTSPQEGR